MKKGITLILLVVSFVFISFNMVFAFGFSSLGGMFGGRILLTKALPIQLLETVGYTCPTYGGTSLSIIPIGSPVGTPTNYFIPSSGFYLANVLQYAYGPREAEESFYNFMSVIF